MTKNLSDILDKYNVIDTSHLYHHEHDKEKLAQDIKSLFKELLEEVIGSGEDLPVDDREWDGVQYRNQLRQTQLSKLNEVLEKL